MEIQTRFDELCKLLESSNDEKAAECLNRLTKGKVLLSIMSTLSLKQTLIKYTQHMNLQEVAGNKQYVEGYSLLIENLKTFKGDEVAGTAIYSQVLYMVLHDVEMRQIFGIISSKRRGIEFIEPIIGQWKEQGLSYEYYHFLDSLFIEKISNSKSP